LKESAKASISCLDDKYQNMEIKNKYKVVIVTSKGGEYSYAEYFKFAAERRGWKVRIFEDNIVGYDESLISFDPDFILLMKNIDFNPNIAIKKHRSKKYFIDFSSLEMHRKSRDINRKEPYELDGAMKQRMEQSQGLLFFAAENEYFRKILTKMKKAFNGIKILPLVPKFVNESVEPKNIMWCDMGGWDDLRSSNKYKEFIRLLSKNLPIKIFGFYGNLSSYLDLNSDLYGGFIPSAIEIIAAIRQNGIYLLTHSDLHIKSSLPSLRIFEATAANAVVISDMHPFAIEHFGNNFLYFDQTADSAAMYKQVKEHYNWIKANPEKAKAMAARAHQIFLEKFTLDKDLDRIAKMHEYVVRQEEEMGLSYPLVY
jgi:hypothetical protein